MAEDRQTVRVVRRFDAPAERLFDAWLDRETVGAWLFATPEGEMTAVEIDPRVGSAWRMVERREGKEWEHRGEYLALDRPRRLMFSFTDPVFALTTYVTVEIEERDGERELTLTHEGVLPEWAAQTMQGWGNDPRRTGTDAGIVGSFCCSVLPVPPVSASVARCGPNRA